jgi:cytochrome c biogenesis protein CcdA
MALLIAFAFLAGIVTILSPCILPLLPVVLSGATGGSRARPLGIITGFVVSFAVLTLALAWLVETLAIGPDVLRWVAAGLILAFGAVLAVPALKVRFATVASVLLARRAGTRSAGPLPSERPPERLALYGAGVLLGLGIGLAWSPCVGPIMASVMTLALSRSVDAGSVLITVAYAAGTAVPLTIIMLGGRELLARVPFLTRRSEGIQRAFGVLMVVTAFAIAAGWDRSLQARLLDAVPGYGAGLTAVESQEPVTRLLDEREARLSAPR